MNYIPLASIRYSFVFLLSLFVFTSCSSNNPHGVNHTFKISFTKSAHQTPITGRLILVLSKKKKPEPRFMAGSYFRSVPFFGRDVKQMKPGTTVVIDTSAMGYPVDNLRNLPEGNYYVQAVMNVYTKFQRSDGHTVWLHMPYWAGQHWNRSPYNLISSVKEIHFNPDKSQAFTVKLDSVLPPIKLPADTRQVKHIKIQSKILTKFWGHPMYLGATVLLPKGYTSHSDAHYPVIYVQGHFNLRAPFGFTQKNPHLSAARKASLKNYNRESGYQFYKEYNSDNFPRMIAVTFQHPSPYYDDSYAVNSANNGPYGDAIMQELIPYIENHFRIIKKPYARVLTGGSTGGWESMALQLYHPDFFGGTWSLYPDELDFHRFQLINLYDDENAFYAPSLALGPERTPFKGWQPILRYMMRDNEGQPVRTVKDMSHMEAVLGSHVRTGQQFGIFFAVFGPVGDDGYPVPLWNLQTGKINHKAAIYARDHGYDLTHYLKQHWSEIGDKLQGKLHVFVGDEDNFYLNLGVYKFQEFLKTTENPHYEGTFRFGRPMKGHGWQPFSNGKLLRVMAKHITKNAPAGTNTRQWKY